MAQNIYYFKKKKRNNGAKFKTKLRLKYRTVQIMNIVTFYPLTGTLDLKGI